MIPELLFKIIQNYDRTSYEPLSKLAYKTFYDYNLKKYVWLFPIKHLQEVIAILGTEILFTKEQATMITQHCPNIKETVTPEPYKGKGFIKIVRQPNIFLITTIINKEEVVKKIPIETVKALWNTILQQPIGKPIKTSTIAKNYCEELKIIRYNRKTNTFDFQKFFGHRTAYFQLYYSLKVLEHYGVIKHYKKGFIARITDKWESQTKMEGNTNE